MFFDLFDSLPLEQKCFLVILAIFSYIFVVVDVVLSVKATKTAAKTVLPAKKIPVVNKGIYIDGIKTPAERAEHYRQGCIRARAAGSKLTKTRIFENRFYVDHFVKPKKLEKMPTIFENEETVLDVTLLADLPVCPDAPVKGTPAKTALVEEADRDPSPVQLFSNISISNLTFPVPAMAPLNFPGAPTEQEPVPMIVPAAPDFIPDQDEPEEPASFDLVDGSESLEQQDHEFVPAPSTATPPVPVLVLPKTKKKKAVVRQRRSSRIATRNLGSCFVGGVRRSHRLMKPS